MASDGCQGHARCKGWSGSGSTLTRVTIGRDLVEKVRKFPVKASLVFRETSYIKGSYQALDSPRGRLSRAAYEPWQRWHRRSTSPRQR